MKITATEVKQNFGKYLDLAAEGEEIIITKNNKDYAKLSGAKPDPVAILNSMVGIVKEEDLPPKGEDERLDHILGRDKEDEDESE